MCAADTYFWNELIYTNFLSCIINHHIPPDRERRFEVVSIDLVHIRVPSHVRHIDGHLQDVDKFFWNRMTRRGFKWMPWKEIGFKNPKQGGYWWWWRWPWQHVWGSPHNHWDSFPEHQAPPHICRQSRFYSKGETKPSPHHLGWFLSLAIWFWCFQNLEP